MRFPNALRLADDGLGVGLGVPRRRKIQNVDHDSEIPVGPSGVPGQFSTSRAELQEILSGGVRPANAIKKGMDQMCTGFLLALLPVSL